MPTSELTPSAPRRPAMEADRLLALALALPILAWQAWILLPPHQQALLKMRAASSVRGGALATGRFFGRRGLAEEAAGDPATAAGWYQLAVLATGTIAGRAASLYDSARDSA